MKPWQFDPTKWIIWTLSKVGLAHKLRRVPADAILRAEVAASNDRNDGDIHNRSHRERMIWAAMKANAGEDPGARTHRWERNV